MSIRWKRDDLAEDLLKRMGLTWEEKAISLDSIDWGESLNNGARLEQPIIKELVEDYALAMQNGDAFPKPVVHSFRGKLPVILSGNQRSAAAKEVAPSDPIPVYFLTTDDKLKADLFLRMANVGLGERINRDNRIKQAVYAVRSLGVSLADAAKLFLVGEGVISLRIRSDDTRRFLDRQNVQGVERLTMSHLEEIGRLDEDMQVKVASICTEVLPSATRLAEVAASINAQKSDAARIKKLREFDSEMKQLAAEKSNLRKSSGNGAIHVRKKRRDKIVSALTGLANFLETGNDGNGFTDLEQMQCHTEKDKAIVSQLWRRVKVRLSIICE